MKMKVSLLLTILFVCSSLLAITSSVEAASYPKSSLIKNLNVSSDQSTESKPSSSEDALLRDMGRRSSGGNEPERYIVILSEPAVSGYTGGIGSFKATKPSAVGRKKLSAESPEVKAYASHLRERQTALVDSVSKTLSRTPKIVHRLQHALNAVVMVLDAAEAEMVAKLPGIKVVEKDTAEHVHTDYGPNWIGADKIWDAIATGGLPGTKGEGVIVGVLDTGINMDHPSFAATGDDGYTHVNPFGAGNYKGWCDPANPKYNASYQCNDKLIGVWDYADASWGETDGPEDNDGHGSHTASTAAGNFLNAGKVTLGTYTYSPPISGVAPHANIIAYDVCGDACYTSDSVAALNQAILDGVDVVNESISMGGNTWTGPKQAAYLAVFEAGIIAVRSAGNSGPGAGTIGSTPPWVTTVAASTHNRAGANSLTNITGGDTVAPGTLDGKGFSGGYGPAPIVYAGSAPYNDAMCLSEFPAGTFTGQIVVCDRGINARVAKGWNVLKGGAGGMILVNTDAGQSLNGDVHHLPAVHLDNVDGAALKSWLSTGAGHQGQIVGTSVDTGAGNGDIMAAFSSRGPHPIPDLLTPDLTNPGVDILAAYRTGAIDAENPTSEYGILSGTSMSSPHTAGAAALLKALRPAWSPAEIKSALMGTSKFQGVLKEDGTTAAIPFDMGSGRVDLANAGMAGLILDETTTEFTAANPAIGGDPKALNLASLANAYCSGSCGWTRIVKATRAGTWNASYITPAGMTLLATPGNFSLSAGQTQELSIQVTLDNTIPQNTYAFGYVVFTEESGGAGSILHLTVAARHLDGKPAISIAPDALASSQAPGIVAEKTFNIRNIGAADLTWSISEDVTTTPIQTAWSDNFDSYSTGSQIIGQGGWTGFGGNPAFGALTSSSVSRSAPNTVAIQGNSDLVHQYSGHNSGRWVYTAWQYVPSGFTGRSYFILLNTYSLPATYNWSTQVTFDGTNNLVGNTGISGGVLSLVKDRWVELRVEIDLTQDTQAFYYDGKLLYHGTWTGEVSGLGALNIGAVDLYANGSSVIYYDDMQLVESGCCDTTSDIPWLSVSALSGTTVPGGTSPLIVSFSSTGLTQGLYKASLCISSNDSTRSPVVVPVELKVESNLIRIFSTPDEPIPDYNGNSPGQISDTIYVPYNFPVSDLNVCLNVPHTWVGDISMTLQHVDTGTTVTLVDRPGVPASTYGCSGSNFDVTVDDEGLDTEIENQCNDPPPAISGFAPGSSPLSAFDGENSQGSWVLTVKDNENGGTGRLLEWCLEIRSSQQLAPAATLKKTVGVIPAVCANTSAITVVPGTTVHYCYEITNTGNTPFTTHTLVDDKIGAILTDSPHLLIPGASFNTIVSAVINSSTANTATWTAFEPTGAPVSSSAQATVTIPETTPVPGINGPGMAVLITLIMLAGAWALRRRSNS